MEQEESKGIFKTQNKDSEIVRTKFPKCINHLKHIYFDDIILYNQDYEGEEHLKLYGVDVAE